MSKQRKTAGKTAKFKFSSDKFFRDTAGRFVEAHRIEDESRALGGAHDSEKLLTHVIPSAAGTFQMAFDKGKL